MRNTILALALMGLVVLGCSDQSGQSQSTGEQQASNEEIAAEVKEKVGEDFDCAKCGMPTTEYPKSAAMIKTEDQVLHYCCNRCMITHLLATIESEQSFRPVSISVVDYYSQELIDGKTAIYISGSDVKGPMGADFISLGNEEDAEAFFEEHHGKEGATFPNFPEKFLTATHD